MSVYTKAITDGKITDFRDVLFWYYGNDWDQFVSSTKGQICVQGECITISSPADLIHYYPYKVDTILPLSLSYNIIEDFFKRGGYNMKIAKKICREVRRMSEDFEYAEGLDPEEYFIL